MSTQTQGLRLPHQQDWVASLVTFLVAVPLSLGIALASGVPPTAGFIAAIIGGILVGSLSGVPLLASGPAAGLSAMVFTAVQNYGLDGLAIVTVTAGLLQIAMGLAKGGRFFTLTPKPVLKGMLAAIGLIILLGQLHVLMGGSVPSSAFESFTGLPSVFSISPILLCGLLAIAIQLGWSKVFPKLTWIPGVLPAVVVSTIVSMAWVMPRIQLSPIGDQIHRSFFALLELGWTSELGGILVTGIGLGIVASAETLLTAEALRPQMEARYLGRGAAVNLDKELLAQGTGNLVSGLVGGIPMTGVIVRSAVNLEAGARTRYATMLHGAWIALFAALLPFVLAQIPLTALAAVLVLTGIRLLNVPLFIQTLSKSKADAAVWIVTTTSIVGFSLLKGLGIGVVFAVVMAQVLQRLKTDETAISNPLGRS